MSKGTQTLPKEAVPDKPFCSQLALEVKHSGIENTVMALWVESVMVEQEGVDSTATSKYHRHGETFDALIVKHET